MAPPARRPAVTPAVMLRLLAMLSLQSVVAAGAGAADVGASTAEPRWVVEPRVGRFQPEQDDYARFYGNDRRRYVGLAFAYRFRPWLEAGGEIAYSRDTGMGALPSGELSGNVEYTLMPAHAYVNLRWEPSRRPLVVPYVGAGLVAAYYRQRIDLQATRRGRTDLGTSLRAGVQLSLDRLDPQPRYGYGEGALKRTFLFVEAQRLTTDVGEADLGGDVYLLGFRFEFGRPIRSHFEAKR